jgi:hypothetical protein
MPYTWNSTLPPMMCNCPVPANLLGTLAWECPRCKKINAPLKGSCDCTPTPFSNVPITGGINAPTSGNTQPSYTAGIDPYNHYYETNNFIKNNEV